MSEPDARWEPMVVPDLFGGIAWAGGRMTHDGPCTFDDVPTPRQCNRGCGLIDFGTVRGRAVIDASPLLRPELEPEMQERIRSDALAMSKRMAKTMGVPDHVVGIPSPWWRRIVQRFTRR